MTIDGNWAEDTTREEKLDYLHSQAWEEHLKQQFVEFLESEEAVQNLSVRDYTTDFYLGGIDIYPDSFNDDHLNVIGRSSVAFRQSGVQATHERLFVTEVNVHLPPAPECMRKEINEELAMHGIENIDVYWGTGALGEMPAPEGVVTPHIVHTDDVTFSVAQEVVQRAVEVFDGVYCSGEHAIKEQP